MELKVNGKAMEISAGTVQELLAELGIEPTVVAVERNLQIVPISVRESVDLREGDQIEIIQLVGGG